MSQEQNRAAIFITTLTQLWNEERERQTARLRIQHRAQAERFMDALWAEIDHSIRPSGLSLPSKPVGHQAMTQPQVYGIAARSAMSRHPNLQE